MKLKPKIKISIIELALSLKICLKFETFLMLVDCLNGHIFSFLLHSRRCKQIFANPPTKLQKNPNANLTQAYLRMPVIFSPNLIPTTIVYFHRLISDYKNSMIKDYKHLKDKMLSILNHSIYFMLQKICLQCKNIANNFCTCLVQATCKKMTTFLHQL